MLDLGTLRIGIEADSSAAKSEIEGVRKTTQDTESQTEQSTKSMSDSWKSFSSSVKTAAAVGFAAITAAVASLVGVANETQEDMGKLDTAFQQAGWSAEEAGNTYKGFVGLLGETDTAVEASNHLAKLCTSEEELSQWTNIAAGVFATFGDSLPLEGLTEAANETAKTGTVVGSLADALNWAGVSEDEFNAKLAACNSEQERSQLITETLNGLYSETGQAYRDNNAELIAYREAQDAMNQALSDLGMALMPIVTDLTNFGTTLLTNCQPAIQWFKDNLPAIKDTFVQWAPAIAAVVGGIMGFQAAQAVIGIITGLQTALSAFKLATEGTTIAQAALNAVMNANPFVLVATIIATLVAAIITLWTTNEGFRTAVIDAWNAIGTTASQVWGAIVTFFTVTVPTAIQTAITWFSQLPERVRTFLTDAINAVSEWASTTASKAQQAGSEFLTNVVSFFSQLPGRVGEFLSNVISRIGSWAGEMASGAARAASDFGSRLISGLASLPGRVVSIGSNIIQGLVDGIRGAAGRVISAIGGVVNDAIGWAKGLLGIASPSKVFKEIGDFTMQGMEEGINGGLKGVLRTVRNAATDVVDAFDVEMPDVEANYRAYSNARLGGAFDGSQGKGSTTNNTSTTTVVVNNYSPKTLSEKESAREFKRSVRQLALA
ncbi:phage tail protein [Thermophilibacter provencensis]|uniref:phage tail protein n=1 Tax=Thermophilibacter provencensis TaxID=1852386 RepID=UPI0023546A85|nr:hypothetical protein [Thermophilibacter provencensis]